VAASPLVDVERRKLTGGCGTPLAVSNLGRIKGCAYWDIADDDGRTNLPGKLAKHVFPPSSVV
jgi:hypothetical protein